MTSMGKRGSQCQYSGTAIAAMCLSDHRSPLSEQESLRSTGSPP